MRHTITIPPDLYGHLETILEDSRFSSVEDFTLYVLRDLASHPGRMDQAVSREAAPSGQEDGLSAEDIEIIRERLQNLGYL